MKRLLHIEVSPRGERSCSKTVADAFIDAYSQGHPTDRVKTINLFKFRLPSFDGDVINAKYAIMHGMPHTDEQKKAWAQVE